MLTLILTTFFLRPGGAFCYCSASMRAFMATWQMVQALISWISTWENPRIGSDQGYRLNEEKLLSAIWHGFQGRSSRNKKRGSILMRVYLPLPRHGNSAFSAKWLYVYITNDEIRTAVVISTLDAWNITNHGIPWTSHQPLSRNSSIKSVIYC